MDIVEKANMTFEVPNIRNNNEKVQMQNKKG